MEQVAADALTAWRETMVKYEYQEGLTQRLDELTGEAFNQATINEIVLWKVNRYVGLSPRLMEEINVLQPLTTGQHRAAEPALLHLLAVRGVDLAMASAILRFRNPKVFPIIDQHAYRALLESELPVRPFSPPTFKVSTYFTYTDAVIEASTRFGVPLEMMDRVLYLADKATGAKLRGYGRIPRESG